MDGDENVLENLSVYCLLTIPTAREESHIRGILAFFRIFASSNPAGFFGARICVPTAPSAPHSSSTAASLSMMTTTTTKTTRTTATITTATNNQPITFNNNQQPQAHPTVLMLGDLFRETRTPSQKDNSQPKKCHHMQKTQHIYIYTCKKNQKRAKQLKHTKHRSTSEAPLHFDTPKQESFSCSFCEAMAMICVNSSCKRSASEQLGKDPSLMAWSNGKLSQISDGYPHTQKQTIIAI